MLLLSCNSVNYMRIATFFQPIKDSEHLDVTTDITIPDQSLSVRDILQRFTRGQIIIPPLETGDDDDIDSDTLDFFDPVDALDSINSFKESMKFNNIKNSTESVESPSKTEQSGVKEGDVNTSEES